MKDYNFFRLDRFWLEIKNSRIFSIASKNPRNLKPIFLMALFAKKDKNLRIPYGCRIFNRTMK